MNNYKTDPDLGAKIQKVLQFKKVETPFTNFNPNFKGISDLFAQMMLQIGLNIADDSLSGTPDRIAKMFTKELFYGLDYNLFPKATTVENKFNYDEMVIVKDMTVNSMCEHHFLPIDGTCKIAYIPDKKVLGLSKFARIVDFFSRRPQIQERLAEQIYHALAYILETDNIAVEINAVHYCMKIRGIKDQNSRTRTTKLGGVFQKIEVKNEFLKS